MADGTDPAELLQPNVTSPGWGLGLVNRAVMDWQVNLAPKKAWVVRGFSWFKANVAPAVTALAPLLPDMEMERAKRPAWNGPPLPWVEVFSARQLYDAAATKPLQFVKAAKTLLVCEMAAATKGIPATTLYEHMRIEPLVFRIADFDRHWLNRMVQRQENSVAELRQRTAQDSQAVFWGLADGACVSYRLADRTRLALKEMVEAEPVGDVIVPANGRLQIAQGERIEGPSVPDPKTGTWD